jgi:hypothetical protein
MRRIFPALLLAAACSTGEADDDGNIQPSACGLAGTMIGSECAGIDECGGANNAIEPSFCEHCLLRPDTHVCEAGRCRMLGAKGSIQTAFGIPPAAVGTRSYTIATIQPIMADGGKVTCEKLLTSCGFLDNPAINTTNSTFKNFDGPASIENAYPALSAAEAGADQILFIQVTTDVQGKGMVKARGCADGITVMENQTTEVPIELMGI